MLKSILFILFIFTCNLLHAIKPFYNFGLYHKSINSFRTEVTKALIDNDFEVVGMYNPASEDTLSVIVFTCDELTSLATGVTDKGAFGATLRIGLVGNDDHTLLTMINPNYFIHAYFGENANSDAVGFICSKVDSLCLNAMSSFSKYPIEYGHDLPLDELKNYHYLPTMPKFADVIQLQEFGAYSDAVSTIKFNVLNGVDHSKLIYELSFQDKETAIFGISFNNEDNIEDELIDFMGVRAIASLPLEIIVQGNKAYILNPKYRIPLYKSDIGISKLFKVLGFSSEIRECMKNISKL